LAEMSVHHNTVNAHVMAGSEHIKGDHAYSLIRNKDKQNVGTVDGTQNGSPEHFFRRERALLMQLVTSWKDRGLRGQKETYRTRRLVQA
jgi:hypothetical protein